MGLRRLEGSLEAFRRARRDAAEIDSESPDSLDARREKTEAFHRARRDTAEIDSESPAGPSEIRAEMGCKRKSGRLM